MDVTAAAEKIWAGIVEGADGGTVHRRGDVLPSTGYLVGGVRNSLINPRSLEEIVSYLRHLPTDLLGFWRDDVTGNYHVDGSTWHVNRGLALGIALRRGELAIWDVVDSRSLDVVR